MRALVSTGAGRAEAHLKCNRRADTHTIQRDRFPSRSPPPHTDQTVLQKHTPPHCCESVNANTYNAYVTHCTADKWEVLGDNSECVCECVYIFYQWQTITRCKTVRQIGHLTHGSIKWVIPYILYIQPIIIIISSSNITQMFNFVSTKNKTRTLGCAVAAALLSWGLRAVKSARMRTADTHAHTHTHEREIQAPERKQAFSLKCNFRTRWPWWLLAVAAPGRKRLKSIECIMTKMKKWKCFLTKISTRKQPNDFLVKEFSHNRFGWC